MVINRFRNDVRTRHTTSSVGLGCASPHAELFASAQCMSSAFPLNRAIETDPLRDPFTSDTGAVTFALFGEEHFGIEIAASGAAPPLPRFGSWMGPGVGGRHGGGSFERVSILFGQFSDTANLRCSAESQSMCARRPCRAAFGAVRCGPVAARNGAPTGRRMRACTSYSTADSAAETSVFPATVRARVFGLLGAFARRQGADSAEESRISRRSPAATPAQSSLLSHAPR